MKVFLFDEFDPETVAMLQALYSRSSNSVIDHVEKVRAKGSAKFMASYYVGYGHASIGDCGVTTLFLEDVSLLACKAVQDNALYSGQESSTRYIDFSKRVLVDPIGSAASERLQRRWVEFYCEISPAVVSHLTARFPAPASGDKRWEKAIQARAFDIVRGFLPAGITTQLSWTTNLRQAHEHLVRLEAHPLEEVRALGRRCRDLLREKYPSSFGHQMSDEELEFARLVASDETYHAPLNALHSTDQFYCRSTVSNDELEATALAVVQKRPRKSTLPKSLSRLGEYQCEFLLDFGSFRDLQRHRGGLCLMPRITEEFGFHPWYFDQLPDLLQRKARSFVQAQLKELHDLGEAISDDVRQYYLPIGMCVPCRLTYDLPQMVYVAELRSNQTVHPTLRHVAQQLGNAVRERHPAVTLYVDNAESEFCIHRGSQDIVEHSSAA